MNKIKDLQINLRPRERFIKYGVESLSDDELLSILIRCGTKNKNAKEIAIDVINELDGIKGFKDITIEELSKIKGLGKVKAIELITALEFYKRVYKISDNKIKIINNEIAYEMFKYDFIDEKQEKLLACFLDTKLNLIGYKIIFVGTINKSIVHPREIFKEAIKRSSSNIILIHNHPSGNPTPSLNDEIFTEKMIALGKEMEIPLIEHLIIGNNKYYSIIKKKEYNDKEIL